MPSRTKPSPAAAPAKAVIATPSTSQIGVSNSNLDSAQVLQAFRALSAHTSRRTTVPSSALPLDGASGNLRDPSNAVYVQLTLNTLSPTSHVKPVRINLPHALHTPGEVSVCLLVKDPQREYKDLLVAQKIKCISRVVGVTKLKGKFKPFDARRALVQEHDMFLADSRIVPTLPNLCGKVFFDAKKNPLTVNLTKPSRLEEELEGAIKATTFTQNKGSCTTIKIGYMAKHTPEELTENLLAAMPAVLSRVKGGWENVHNVDVKTGNSAALPVWNQKLGVKTHATPSVEKVATPATPAKRVAEIQEDATPSKKSPVKKVQLAETAAVKTPSPRKTRAAAAAKANIAVEAAATATPSKTPAKGTPKKIASSVSRSARNVK
ncbi:Ribosomal protein L1/ribosomal biogenesis protein [Kalmanozyma brasiliensis GHG001]|uniref:Ribosomal L1 domain-containing protein 1 n=1 Tax=Kalmanozyma brasiliensis (strain GHG001) TaxID=1365824 RepID=V5EY55_KALBG|nr:Ribosomal protein L1/ribosomal biogenesis protein [Kalmanozyma brasiliensis GHG001]EST07574.1 Ribosomal protein L1/ribosomal biogenesis protein [Kalmanozyma brasiliensis GHG001]